MTPTGVKSYGHKSMSDKGSKHPSSIASGLQTVDKQGGSPPGAMEAGSGSDKHKKSVKRGDGTENLKADGSKKRGSILKAPGSGSSHLPGEVRKHSGTKAPKSVKQPK